MHARLYAVACIRSVRDGLHMAFLQRMISPPLAGQFVIEFRAGLGGRQDLRVAAAILKIDVHVTRIGFPGAAGEVGNVDRV